MSKSWIGVVAGSSVAIVALFVTSRKADNADDAQGSAAQYAADHKNRPTVIEQAHACEASAKTLQDEYTKRSIRNLAASHRDQAGKQLREIEPMIDARITQCTKALGGARDYLKAGHDPDVEPALTSIPARIEHFKRLKQTLGELATVLASPTPPDDLGPKFDAVDSALR